MINDDAREQMLSVAANEAVRYTRSLQQRSNATPLLPQSARRDEKARVRSSPTELEYRSLLSPSSRRGDVRKAADSDQESTLQTWPPRQSLIRPRAAAAARAAAVARAAPEPEKATADAPLFEYPPPPPSSSVLQPPPLSRTSPRSTLRSDSPLLAAAFGRNASAAVTSHSAYRELERRLRNERAKPQNGLASSPLPPTRGATATVNLDDNDEDAVQAWGCHLATMLASRAITQLEYDRLAASLPYAFTSCLSSSSQPAARGAAAADSTTHHLGRNASSDRTLEDALLFGSSDIVPLYIGSPRRAVDSQTFYKSASPPPVPPPRPPTPEERSASQLLEQRLLGAQEIVLETPEAKEAALAKIARIEAELSVVQAQLREVESANYGEMVRRHSRQCCVTSFVIGFSPFFFFFFFSLQVRAEARLAAAARRSSPQARSAVDLEVERRRRAEERSPRGLSSPASKATRASPPVFDEGEVDITRAMAQLDVLKSRSAMQTLF